MTKFGSWPDLVGESSEDRIGDADCGGKGAAAGAALQRVLGFEIVR